MVQSRTTKNALHDLGYKIFLDRYAQKDMTRQTLSLGDTVIVVVNPQTGQREVGEVQALDLPSVTIKLLDGEVVQRDIEHVDKPIETDPAQMMDRVAAGIAAVEGNAPLQEEWTEKFRWVLDDWKFVPGGRILTAAGTDQDLTFYNCYVIPSPQDSREGIMQTLGQMTEIMSRGGGVGINLSTLRPRHAYVKGVNGRSSGSVSWGALYSFVTGLIEQGGSRRGALMLILNDWHPDVFDFINSKRQAGNITNANISVGLSDKFMEAIKHDGDWDLLFPDTHDPDYDDLWDGDLDTWMAAGRRVIHHRTIKARELWDAIIESAWASAEPGVWFRERSNKMANSWYFNPLIATNPCVTGDTRIYTDQGLVKAVDLFNDETEINVAIDGRFGSDPALTPSSRVFRTGTKPVYRLQTEEGYFVRATADHRIMTPNGWVELQNLKAGDRIHILNRAGGFGQQGDQATGRTLGWAASGNSAMRDSMVNSFAARSVQTAGGSAVAAVAERVDAIAEHEIVENQVPEVVFQGTEAMQQGFLQAVFAANGRFDAASGLVLLTSAHRTFLEGVQMLLANFGVYSRLVADRDELVISNKPVVTFAHQIGFASDDVQADLMAYVERINTGLLHEPFVATVAEITEDGVEDVYDLTEPVTHSFIANGLCVHNCGEQPLGGFSVCNLGAINLSRFYDEEADDVAWDALSKTVRYATRFLDNVIDTTPYFFEENAQIQGDERRVGLGTMGIAELMIRLRIRYGSEESVDFIEKIYKFIATNAYQMSVELAKEKGAFPKFDAEKLLESGFMLQMPEDLRDDVREHGIRNVTLLTQAPTGTTGTMVNTSTGIEPFFSWVYYRKSRLGLHEENVPIVQEWYDENPGADELPDYFAAAMDLTPKEHVRVQAAFQRWIDSAISKTCNVPNSYTVDQTRELYEYMYDLGCKGGTIYRDGSRDEQVLMLKGDERAENEMQDNEAAKSAERIEQVATPHRVYPRPGKLSGVTVNCATPFGTAYVTMNSDDNGYPFEVFITAPGKAGSDLQADAEGLGRMISLSLRTTEPHNRLEMIKLIIEQLRDIGGARSVGFGPRRVISLPDSVARALEEHYFHEDQAQQLGLPMADLPAPVEPSYTAVEIEPEADHSQNNGTMISGADMCPSCGTISLIRAEGCRKCLTCGYSEC